MVVDDDPETTVTFKKSLEHGSYKNGQNIITFEVYTYNDPELALSEFMPDFYDLLLIDIDMPTMNGFDLYDKIKEIDPRARVCFITVYEINYRALRTIFEEELECFIRKPIEMSNIIRRVIAEMNLI